jgi:hypothetical protein
MDAVWCEIRRLDGLFATPYSAALLSVCVVTARHVPPDHCSVTVRQLIGDVPRRNWAAERFVCRMVWRMFAPRSKKVEVRK